MDINFYQLKSGGKAIGFTYASPEEAQNYGGAILTEIPAGQHFVTRQRRTKEGRMETLLASVEIGKPLLLEGEDDKPLPAPAPPKAVPLPQVVKDASDADLEVMAARNGVTVNEAWKKRSRQLRNADVAVALAKQNAR